MHRIVNKAVAMLSSIAACHPGASSTPTARHTAPPPPSSEPLNDAPGSPDDLQARGAFRAIEDGDGRNATPELADRWLTVTIKTQATDLSWWAIAAGGQLRSGEVVVVDVDLYRPAHVYVINVSATGRSTLLYPAAVIEEDTQLDRGRHRLPPKRSDAPYIKLDDEIGVEHFFIIATLEPIRDADDKLGEMVERLGRGESPVVMVRDTPSSPRRRASGGPVTRKTTDEELFEANAAVIPAMRSRGSFRAYPNGAAIDAKAGGDGVVVVPFRLEHI